MNPILIALAKGLLSAIASKIFGSIFGGKSIEQYFQEMIAEIKVLLHIEAVSNDITIIKGTVDGVISQMTIDYPNKKSSGATDAELIAFLAPIEASLDENIMGPLEALTDSNEAKGNAQQSLLVYMVGGGMQFAVLQEMALRDGTVSNPKDSQYAKDLMTYAQKYSTRASMLLTKIKTARLGAISPASCVVGEAAAMMAGKALTKESVLKDLEGKVEGEEVEITGGDVGWPSGLTPNTYYVQDTWLGTYSCVHTVQSSVWYPCPTDSPHLATCRKCRDAYYAAQSAQFDKDWAGTSTLIAAWKQLITDPLPTK